MRVIQYVEVKSPCALGEALEKSGKLNSQASFKGKRSLICSFWNAGNGCSLQPGDSWLSDEPGSAYVF